MVEHTFHLKALPVEAHLFRVELGKKISKSLSSLQAHQRFNIMQTHYAYYGTGHYDWFCRKVYKQHH
jgi:hypothetical protein